jgi:hypothetical protein
MRQDDGAGDVAWGRSTLGARVVGGRRVGEVWAPAADPAPSEAQATLASAHQGARPPRQFLAGAGLGAPGWVPSTQFVTRLVRPSLGKELNRRHAGFQESERHRTKRGQASPTAR